MRETIKTVIIWIAILLAVIGIWNYSSQFQPPRTSPSAK
jgi:uncharacterized membrane protein YidH (DUF202 family)